MKQIVVLLTALAMVFTGQAQTSRIISGKTNFSIKYWAGTCEGSFAAPQGTMKFDPANPGATVIDVSVAANTFKSGNSTRDKDVKAKKYLDAASHPQVRFKSSSVTLKGGTYYAAGTLSLKGVSKQVSIPFKASKNADGSYTITSNFTLDRLDYKVGESTMTMKDIVTLSMSAVIK